MDHRLLAGHVIFFLVAVTMINIYLIDEYFIQKMEPKNLLKLLNFRRELALQLIKSQHNNYGLDDSEATQKTFNIHEHCIAPQNAQYENGQIWIGDWTTSVNNINVSA